jgi:NAD(P)H-flavin reductase
VLLIALNVLFAVLRHAAASPQEFALLPRLLDWQQKGLLQLQLHTTQDYGPIPSSCQQQADEVQQQPGPPVERVTGRIAEVHLQAAMQQLQQGAARAQEVDAYVCGPPSMTDEVVGLLQKLGVPSSCIRTEKWW